VLVVSIVLQQLMYLLQFENIWVNGDIFDLLLEKCSLQIVIPVILDFFGQLGARRCLMATFTQQLHYYY
jgi:hypothetical protein